MPLVPNLIFVIIFGLGLLLPDIYLGYYKGMLNCTIPTTTLVGVIGFAGILSFVKNRKFQYTLAAIIIVAQGIQINHWAYFGAPIHSQDITKVFFEIDEIFQTGAQLTENLWPAWAATFISAFIIFWGVTVTRKCYNIPYSLVLVVLIVSITPILSFIKGPDSFYTKPTSSTIYNTLRAFSDWLVNSRKHSLNLNYKPYEINYSSPVVKNIVLIVGESQSSRYMQLYGYKQNNTPFLNGLKNDPNFAHTKGISSSVSTISSLQLFFNNFHNPGFTEIIRNKSANLFRLARHQGYKTFIISGQNEKLFHDTGTEFVDYLVFEKSMSEQLIKKGDEVLLDKFSDLEFSDRNFIVIHLRHIHSPFSEYAKYISSNYSKQTNSRTNQTQQDYADAISYNDFWAQQCIKIVKEKLPNDTVIIFTSDHGELVGEDGLFGHNLMRPEVADVPVWVYSIGSDKKLNAYIKQQTVCSHYDLGNEIAKLFGAEIINPNECSKTQFVHGTELTTNYELIPWEKSSSGAKFLEVQRVDKAILNHCPVKINP